MNWNDLNIRARFEEELLFEQFKKYQSLKKKASAASRVAELVQPTGGPFLLQENGFYLLQENGKKIII